MGAFARRGGRVVASLLARGVRLGVSAALDVARLCGQGAVLLVRQSWALARADVEGARIGAEGAAELAPTARPRVARAAKAVKARYVAWRLTAGR